MPSTSKPTNSPNSLPTSGPTGLPTLSSTFPPSYLPRSLTPAPTGRPTMSPTTFLMNAPIYRVGAPTPSRTARPSPSPTARPSPSPTAPTYLLGNPTSSQHKSIITPFHLPHTIAQLPTRQPHLVSISVLSRCSSLESPLFVIREAYKLQRGKKLSPLRRRSQR